MGLGFQDPIGLFRGYIGLLESRNFKPNTVNGKSSTLLIPTFEVQVTLLGGTLVSGIILHHLISPF